MFGKFSRKIYFIIAFLFCFFTFGFKMKSKPGLKKIIFSYGLDQKNQVNTPLRDLSLVPFSVCSDRERIVCVSIYYF